MNAECTILVASCDKCADLLGPFLDAVHKGCWEMWGVKCLADNGIAYDFSKRGLPSFKTRLVEDLKGQVFRIVPNNWIVRVQNAFNLGAKERK